MKLKKLQEQRVKLVADMDAILNVEVREEGEVLDAKAFADLKAEVERIDAEVKAIKDLEILKSGKPEKKATEGEKDMEVREMLVNGQEVEFRATGTAIAGGAPQVTIPGIIEQIATISPLFDSCSKIDTASNSAITVQGNKPSKFVKTAELAEYTKANVSNVEKILKANKLGLIIEVSEELLADASYDVAGEIQRQMTEGCALSVNEMVVEKLEADVDSVKVANTVLDADCVLDMYYSMKQAYRTGASFVVNPVQEIAIAKLKDTTGQPLMIANFTGTPGFTILGCKVIVDENVINPMLVNLEKAVKVGLRRNMEVKRDDSVGFTSDSVAFKGSIRLDAVTLLSEAIVKADKLTAVKRK